MAATHSVAIPLASNPGFTARNRSKLRNRRPDATRATSASAICTPTRIDRARARALPDVDPRPESRSPTKTPLRNERTAGAIAQAAATNTLVTMMNPTVARSTWTSASRGISIGLAPTRSRTAAVAPTKPITEAMTARTSDSVRKCDTRRA